MEAADDPRIRIGLSALTALGARAKGFDFLPRQRVSSVLAGRRASRLRGRGLEFEEIRSYLPGDDTRSIDWRVTARTGSPHVRVMREERDRPALMLIDQRQAMFFGSVLNMKSVTAAEFTALAAARIRAAGDRVGGIVFSDTDAVTVRPRSSDAAVERLLAVTASKNAALSATAPSVPDAPAQLNRVLMQAARIASHDWLILIVSDFDGADEATFRALSAMTRANDVVMVPVFDPLAHEVPATGRMVAGDGRLQVELDLSQAKVRANLAEVGGERLKRLAAWQDRLDVAMVPLSTGEQTETQVLRLFAAPQSARQRWDGGPR